MKHRISLVALVVMACSSKDPIPVPVAADYFPLKSGAYFVYEVDSTVINDNVDTTYSYQVRIDVADSFPNLGGGYTYPLHRTWRATSADSWKAMPVWSARATPNEVIVNQGNISYVKLAGPVVNGKEWDGNSLNTLGGVEKCANGTFTCDLYQMQDVGASYSVGTVSYPNSLVVVENDNKDLIVNQDTRSEIYAKGIGLLERNSVYLEYCTDPDCIGTQFVNKGLTYKQMIVEYGGL